MKNIKDIYNVMVCPICESDNCYIYSIDEIEFESNRKGHYYVDCRCKDCKKDFRLYTKFEYNITEAYTK